MKNNFRYADSNTKKVVDALFISNKSFRFSETCIGAFFNKVCYPKLSYFLVIASMIVVLYQSILPASFSMISPILLIIALILADKSKIFITKSIWWLVGVYFILCISASIAVFSGINPVMIFTGLLLWFQFGLYIVVTSPLGIDRISRVIIFAILPISVYGLFQFISGKTSSALWISEFEKGIGLRAFSILGDPNVFGMLSAIGLIMCVFYAISRNMKYFILSPVFITAVLLSFSRTTWLSLSISAVLITILVYRKYIVYTSISLLVLTIPQVRERILVVFNPDFIRISSIDGRIWIFNNVIHLFKQRPVLGYGPGSYGGETALKFASPVYHRGIQDGFVPIYYSDSSWFQLLVQGGLLSFLFFVGFFVSCSVQIYNNFSKLNDRIYLAGLSTVTFIAVSALTSNVMEFGSVIIPASLIIGASLNES